MKSDKSGKGPDSFVTSAKEERGKAGLLGGTIDSKDPLAFVGLRLGATQRAKDLVLKDLVFERQEELNAFINTSSIPNQGTYRKCPKGLYISTF